MIDSPDRSASGFVAGGGTGNSLRYDWHTDDPHEAGMMVASLVPMGARVLDVGYLEEQLRDGLMSIYLPKKTSFPKTGNIPIFEQE